MADDRILEHVMPRLAALEQENERLRAWLGHLEHGHLAAGAREQVGADASPRATSRRGLLTRLAAGAAATLGAGIALERAAQPAAAATSKLTSPPATGGTSTSGDGVYGQTAATGPAAGVHGYSGSAAGYGVYGNGPNGYGVVGTSGSATGAGVWANNTKGDGIYGGSQSASGAGVRGYTDGVYGFGVYGHSDGAHGAGVYATGVAGVWGNGNQGVYGTGSFAGVLGVGGDYAVYADGTLCTSGDFTALGKKSALVPAEDGYLRTLYCLESPECWFEDFGTAQLVGGAASVPIEPLFAATIRTDQFHIFLTPLGLCEGLCVSAVDPTGFSVQELRGGTSTVAFSYRVVGRRKDTEAPRLKKVLPPRAPVVAASPAAPPATAPPVSVPKGHS